jgi:hypothetical protein
MGTCKTLADLESSVFVQGCVDEALYVMYRPYLQRTLKCAGTDTNSCGDTLTPLPGRFTQMALIGALWTCVSDSNIPFPLTQDVTYTVTS